MSGAVVKQEAIAIAAEYEGQVERVGIAQGLLHAVTNAVRVVLRFDDADWQIGLEIKQVVRALLGTPAVQLAAHDDTAGGEGNLFAHLGRKVPTRLLERRGNELGADVALGEIFFH